MLSVDPGPPLVQFSEVIGTWQRLVALWARCASLPTAPSTAPSSQCWETTSPNSRGLAVKMSFRMYRSKTAVGLDMFLVSRSF